MILCKGHLGSRNRFGIELTNNESVDYADIATTDVPCNAHRLKETIYFSKFISSLTTLNL